MLVASRSALGQAGFKLSALKNQLVFSDTCLPRPPLPGARCHHVRLAAWITGSESQGWSRRLTFISSLSFYPFSIKFIGKHFPTALAHPRPLDFAPTRLSEALCPRVF